MPKNNTTKKESESVIYLIKKQMYFILYVLKFQNVLYDSHLYLK